MKTLKDFKCAHNSEISCCEDQGKSGNPHAVDTYDLRQEAKEWVEHYKKFYDKSMTEDNFHSFPNASEAMAVINFIEIFFNLKNGNHPNS